MVHRRLIVRAALLALAVLAVTAGSAWADSSNSGTITGTVVDPSGQPLAGVLVSTPASGGTETVVTDSNGDFALGNLPAPATYDITFTPPAPYGAETVPGFQDQPGQTEQYGPITLQYAPGSIAGRVTDAAGRALPGMHVLVYALGQSNPTATGVSGNDGRYMISSVPAGTYNVAVLDGLLQPDKQSLTVSPAATAPYNPRLPAPLIPHGTSARNAARDLRWLNRERAAAGLPGGIVQNTRWSAECAAHDAYEVRNHVLSHEENPHAPGASFGGFWAGQSSVLSVGAAWLPGHNPWDDAPIHLIQLFSPSLSVIGIDESRGEACATTWPGMVRPAPAQDTVFTYPGNGVRGVPPSENARELPFVPGDFVGIPQGQTAGRELFVYLNQAGQTGQAQVKILDATVSGPHGPVRLRWVDNSTRQLGPDLSGGIILPVRPLASHAHYTATVTLRDGTGTISHTWSFSTGR